MEKIKIAGLDEEIYYTVSNDGMPIYVWKNIYAHSFYLSLNVNYGSLDTEFMVNNKKYKAPNGIAHFMEHIKFNVDKDTTANDLFDPLGSDINAFTTFKYTSYLAYGVNEVLTNLNNLLDYVINPYFTKEIIKKEKGIICSEINMGEDQPYNKLFFEFNKCIYQKEKFRNLITGTVEDVKKIELKDINLIYNTFYHPQNMFLIVCGNVNPYEIEATVNENLKKKNIGEFSGFEIIKTKEPRKVNEKEKIIETNVEVPKAKVGLKLERKEFKNFDKIKLTIILNILLEANFGDSSDLKEELLENDLITFMSGACSVEDDYVVLDVTMESKIIDEAIKIIIKTFENFRVDEEDIRRKINSNIATLVLSYEDVEQVNGMLQNYIINFEGIVPNIKEIYESITMDEVLEVANKINTNEMVVVKMLKNNN